MYTIALLPEAGDGVSFMNVRNLLTAMHIASRWMRTPLNDVPTAKAVVTQVNTGYSLQTSDGTNWYPQFMPEYLQELDMDGEWFRVKADARDGEIIESGPTTTWQAAIDSFDHPLDYYPAKYGVRLYDWAPGGPRTTTFIWIW